MGRVQRSSGLSRSATSKGMYGRRVGGGEWKERVWHKIEHEVVDG